jgi:hypothetical protein
MPYAPTPLGMLIKLSETLLMFELTIPLMEEIDNMIDMIREPQHIVLSLLQDKQP